MTTEQYSIGYEAGYQDGWNAATDTHPTPQPKAAQEPVGFVGYGDEIVWKKKPPPETDLYTEPQPKAEPQEPVCEVANVLGNMVTALCEGVPPAPGDKLYTAPQPAKRLTDEEIDRIALDYMNLDRGAYEYRLVCKMARAIEDAIWSKA
jgi:hypothetical protein